MRQWDEAEVVPPELHPVEEGNEGWGGWQREAQVNEKSQQAEPALSEDWNWKLEGGVSDCIRSWNFRISAGYQEAVPSGPVLVWATESCSQCQAIHELLTQVLLTLKLKGWEETGWGRSPIFSSLPLLSQTENVP